MRGDSNGRRHDETNGRDGKHPSRIGVRDMLSYQLPVPDGAGTPRHEKPELWFGTANWHGGFCYVPPRPLRRTSLRATFFLRPAFMRFHFPFVVPTV